MKGVVRSIRFSEEEYRIAKEVAEKLGIGFSDFVRLAVRKMLTEMSFFDERTKKIFEILKRGKNRNEN